MVRHLNNRIGIATSVLAVVACSGLATASIQKTGSVVPEDVSADGRVVVGSNWNGDDAAFWTAEGGVVGIQSMTSEPEGLYLANAVSGDGQTLVGNSDYWGYALGQDGSFTKEMGYEVQGVSYDGSIKVGHEGYYTAGYWTTGNVMTPLKNQEGVDVSGRARDVSADGKTIIGFADNILSPSHNEAAFRWTEETGAVALDFGGLDAAYSQATGISDDGSTIIGSFDTSDGKSKAYRWTEDGGAEVLSSFEDSKYCNVWAVSGDGSIAVGSSTGPMYAQSAVVWDAEGEVHLLNEYLNEQGLMWDTNTWNLDSVSGISADGMTFIGSGQFNDEYVGWVASIPEPGVGMLVMGMMGLVGLKRRSA
ncbi:hypothetical protein JD969_14145 [Planctomycetota bacterium]|nr:hypothetical protein JD969_14145 [Planctomycetota bacterium]